jgi:uncharacterized protein (TIGR03437 family)
VILLGLVGSVSAAPRLRLSTAAIGPINLAVGAAGPLQTVEAFNIGDGDLALSATTTATWLNVSVGETGNCAQRSGICTPIRIELNTQGLAKGAHTGVVTILDPNALDAPQFLTVTVQAGGAVPPKIEFFVTPGGSQEFVIRAGNNINLKASTGGPEWLSLPAEGLGSFRYDFNYRIVARHLANMAEGDYSNQLTVSGSTIPDENSTIPVTLRVAGAPIYDAPAQLRFRAAENGPPHITAFDLPNRGYGQVLASELRVSTAEGGEWLTAEIFADGQAFRVRSAQAGLAPGVYSGTLTVVTNAANSEQLIPVTLDVMPAAAPAIDFSTLTNELRVDPAAIMAPGMLARIRGVQLTTQDPAAAETTPWPDTLAGTRLLVNGIPAALSAVSSGEISFQIPEAIDPGDAIIQVERDGQPGNQILATVGWRAPRLQLSTGTFGKVLLDDGTLAIPAVYGGRPAAAGETIAIHLIGLGRSDPGAGAAEPVQVSFGRSLFSPGAVVEASPTLVPDAPGRYIVKVLIPENAPRADRVDLAVTAAGVTSNTVQLAIQ